MPSPGHIFSAPGLVVEGGVVHLCHLLAHGPVRGDPVLQPVQLPASLAWTSTSVMGKTRRVHGSVCLIKYACSEYAYNAFLINAYNAYNEDLRA